MESRFTPVSRRLPMKLEGLNRARSRHSWPVAEVPSLTLCRALSLKGPLSKLNGISHTVRSKSAELVTQLSLQFIVRIEIAKRIASL